MRASIRSTVLLLGGCLAGLVSAHVAVSRSGAPAAIDAPEWLSYAEPEGGNPYRAAHYLLAGRLPPPDPVLRESEAATDSTGADLAGSCVYRLRFRGPAAPWWQLRAESRDESLDAARSSISSAAVPRGPAGGFEITVSHGVQPGHWLDPGTVGTFSLILTASSASGTAAPQLPRIERTGCG